VAWQAQRLQVLNPVVRIGRVPAAPIDVVDGQALAPATYVFFHRHTTLDALMIVSLPRCLTQAGESEAIHFLCVALVDTETHAHSVWQGWHQFSIISPPAGQLDSARSGWATTRTVQLTAYYSAFSFTLRDCTLPAALGLRVAG
jgi:hypothetical protein